MIDLPQLLTSCSRVLRPRWERVLLHSMTLVTTSVSLLVTFAGMLLVFGDHMHHVQVFLLALLVQSLYGFFVTPRLIEYCKRLKDSKPRTPDDIWEAVLFGVLWLVMLSMSASFAVLFFFGGSVQEDRDRMAEHLEHVADQDRKKFEQAQHDAHRQHVFASGEAFFDQAQRYIGAQQPNALRNQLEGRVTVVTSQLAQTQGLTDAASKAVARANRNKRAQLRERGFVPRAANKTYAKATAHHQTLIEEQVALGKQKARLEAGLAIVNADKTSADAHIQKYHDLREQLPVLPMDASAQAVQQREHKILEAKGILLSWEPPLARACQSLGAELRQGLDACEAVGVAPEYERFVSEASASLLRDSYLLQAKELRLPLRREELVAAYRDAKALAEDPDYADQLEDRNVVQVVGLAPKQVLNAALVAIPTGLVWDLLLFIVALISSQYMTSRQALKMAVEGGLIYYPNGRAIPSVDLNTADQHLVYILVKAGILIIRDSKDPSAPPTYEVHEDSYDEVAECFDRVKK